MLQQALTRKPSGEARLRHVREYIRSQIKTREDGPARNVYAYEQQPNLC
jgi:hypothetical protein